MFSQLEKKDNQFISLVLEKPQNSSRIGGQLLNKRPARDDLRANNFRPEASHGHGTGAFPAKKLYTMSTLTAAPLGYEAFKLNTRLGKSCVSRGHRRERQEAADGLPLREHRDQ